MKVKALLFRSVLWFSTATFLLLPTLVQGESYRGTGPLPNIGCETPDFTLPDTKGNMVSLSDFKGKVILLSFWSCYTDKCFTSTKALDDLIVEFAGRGFAAPTVCSEIPPTLAENDYAGLLKRCSAGQTVLIDKGKKQKGRYKVRRLPASFLIDTDFCIREKFVGVAPLLKPEFRARVLELLAEAPESSP